VPPPCPSRREGPSSERQAPRPRPMALDARAESKATGCCRHAYGCAGQRPPQMPDGGWEVKSGADAYVGCRIFFVFVAFCLGPPPPPGQLRLAPQRVPFGVRAPTPFWPLVLSGYIPYALSYHMPHVLCPGFRSRHCDTYDIYMRGSTDNSELHIHTTAPPKPR
jgi:hypothetical protein